MSVGAFFDTIIYVALGIYMLYIAKKTKDKLGNKSKWIIAGGIAMLILAIINFITKFVK